MLYNPSYTLLATIARNFFHLDISSASPADWELVLEQLSIEQVGACAIPLELNLHFGGDPAVAFSQLREYAKACAAFGQPGIVSHDHYSMITWTDDPADEAKVVDSKWFNYYLSRLEGRQFHRESILSIARDTKTVVKRLPVPSPADLRRKGLVVGYVQSGKTATMAGVASLAFDLGYSLVVILGGGLESLRRQTQKRLMGDLAYIANGMRVEAQWLTFGEVPGFNRHASAASQLNGAILGHQKAIAVLLKNARVLHGFTNWIASIGERAKELKVLVLDDECDTMQDVNAGTPRQASLTNKRVRELVFRTFQGRAGYIGFTATPYATVLNECDQPGQLESLYPNDFIHAQYEPAMYFGGRQVFGDPGIVDAPSFATTIPGDELAVVHSAETMATISTDDCPESLKASLAWFLLCVAEARLSETPTHLTMLLHVSQAQALHAEVARIVKAMLVAWAGDTAKLGREIDRAHRLCGQVSVEGIEAIRPGYREYVPEMQMGWHSLEELKVEVQSVLWEFHHRQSGSSPGHLALRMSVVNAANESLVYAEDRKEAVLAVGGNVLARGLTLEGLVSTYFARKPTYGDTLVQMGRWFGYRRGIELMPRIWIDDDMLEAYRAMVRQEDMLRDQISAYSGKITPLQFGPRLVRNPGNAILLTARMNMADDVGFDYSGQLMYTLKWENARLTEYEQAARELISSLGEPCKEAPVVLWDQAPIQAIMKFIQDYNAVEVETLRTEWLVRYLGNEAQKGRITEWNVVVRGGVSSKPWRIGYRNLDVPKVIRSNIYNPYSKGDSVFGIRTLMTSGDEVCDLDKAEVPPKERKGQSLLERRLKATSKPLLILYPIDSRPIQEPDSDDNFSPLHLENVDTLMGYAILFPLSLEDAGGETYVQLRPAQIGLDLGKAQRVVGEFERIAGAEIGLVAAPREVLGEQGELEDEYDEDGALIALPESAFHFDVLARAEEDGAIVINAKAVEAVALRLQLSADTVREAAFCHALVAWCLQRVAGYAERQGRGEGADAGYFDAIAGFVMREGMRLDLDVSDVYQDLLERQSDVVREARRGLSGRTAGRTVRSVIESMRSASRLSIGALS